MSDRTREQNLKPESEGERLAAAAVRRHDEGADRSTMYVTSASRAVVAVDAAEPAIRRDERQRVLALLRAEHEALPVGESLAAAMLKRIASLLVSDLKNAIHNERWRKKPVVVEAALCAALLDAFEKDWSALPSWAADAYEQGVIVAVRREDLTIKTLEGDHRARRDDWVIRGAQGELYPCKPDIFAATYEPAPSPVGETRHGEILRPAIDAAFAEAERLDALDDLEAERIGDEGPQVFVVRKMLEAAMPHLAASLPSGDEERGEPFDGEVCKSCGHPVAESCPTYWHAPDALWNEVEGGPGGVRCIACFTRDAEAKGIHVAWRAVTDRGEQDCSCTWDEVDGAEFIVRYNPNCSRHAAASSSGETGGRRMFDTALGPIRVIPECKVAACCANGERCWEAGRCLRDPALTPPVGESGDERGVELIAAERRRQVEAEGWTPKHDDEHRGGELAMAAACYATLRNPYFARALRWPFEPAAWKPSPDDRIHELVKAGALIAAEIDRLCREIPSEGQQ